MTLKKIAGCLLFYLMSCNMMNAQSDSLKAVTEKMKIDVHIENSSLRDTLGGKVLAETNKLKIDTGQYVIPIGQEQVVVGMLVNNTARVKGKGDYSAYWKDSTKTGNRYTWVFVLDDFKERCKNKNISTNNNDLSKRLCKLLGLDITDKRDTIVYMSVFSKDLFRPAYNPDITITTKNDIQGKNTQINNLDDITTRRWFLEQQFKNPYPWTRMGYTYDWGDETQTQDYVGVTEFILKPNSQIQSVKFYSIYNFF